MRDINLQHSITLLLFSHTSPPALSGHDMSKITSPCKRDVMKKLEGKLKSLGSNDDEHRPDRKCELGLLHEPVQMLLHMFGTEYVLGCAAHW